MTALVPNLVLSQVLIGNFKFVYESIEAEPLQTTVM